MLKKITDWFRWRKTKRLMREGQGPIIAMLRAGLFGRWKPCANPGWYNEHWEEQRDGDWVQIGTSIQTGRERWLNTKTSAQEERGHCDA